MHTHSPIARPPVQAGLMAIPVGLWLFSLGCDFLSLQSGHAAVWWACAFHAITGGLVGAAGLAVTRLVLLLELRDPQVRRIGLLHLGLLAAILMLYAVNAWARLQGLLPPSVCVGLSILALAMLGASASLRRT